MPLTARTVVVPERVAPVGFAASAIVTSEDAVVTVLPNASWSATRMAGSKVAWLSAVPGWSRNANRATGGEGGGGGGGRGETPESPPPGWPATLAPQQ